jgi:hypothetical protein
MWSTYSLRSLLKPIPLKALQAVRACCRCNAVSREMRGVVLGGLGGYRRVLVLVRHIVGCRLLGGAIKTTFWKGGSVGTGDSFCVALEDGAESIALKLSARLRAGAILLDEASGAGN